jgi:RNA polymerase sigma-70 factor, ECF subfamily
VYEADRKLVARMLAGEQRAFDAFFVASAQRLAAFAARRSGLDSASLEDVVQNTLIKAVRHLASYRGESALFTWLCEICRHELADVTRKSGRRPAHVSLFEPGARAAVAALPAPGHLEPAVRAESAEHRAAVIRVLAALPPAYAQALEAKYADGLSVEEISRLLGLTGIATQSLLARARQAFREKWTHAVNSIGALSRGAPL